MRTPILNGTAATGLAATLALALAVGLAMPAGAQRGAPPALDATTAKALNAAIEALNEQQYDAARAAIATLSFDRLSPYERSKVEQVLFNLAYEAGQYDEARAHLVSAIDAGGLNADEVSQARYQRAQLFMSEERWREGADALEDWFATAAAPNSAAYYLLAVAYYQLNDFARALPPARQAVTLMEQPQESWLGMLTALYLQQEQYTEAIPLLHRLVALVPAKKTYWMQLSSAYGQNEDYASSVSILQLAYNAGLLTQESELRRLADLLLFNDLPYRGAEVLETALEAGTVQPDDQVYEKLANCWIAAREFDKALLPLERGAELAMSGDLFVRLGEVNVEREDWLAAETALQRGIGKGQLNDLGNAQFLMGVVLYAQQRLPEARAWFDEARQSPPHRTAADEYLRVIAAELTPRIAL